MSLIYQSLKKLQSEDAAESGPFPGEPDAPSGGGFRRRTLLWLLPGALLLALGVLVAWSAGPGPREGNKPSRPAAVPDKGNETASSDAARRKDADSEDSPAGESPEPSREPGKAGATDRKVRTGAPPSENKGPRLLHFACRRNGTRARLSFEFRREPEVPQTTWREESRTLEVSFSGTAAPDPDTLSGRADRAGLDLRMESADPLAFRLSGQRLREHTVFTLPGSGEYGPRCVIALRYASRDRTTDAESRQDAAPETTEPASDAPKESPSDEAEQAGPTPRDRENEPASSKSLRIDSGTSKPGRRSPESSGLARARRLLERGEADRAGEILRRHLEQNPGHSRARLLLSRILLREDERGRAVSVLRQGIRLDPENIRLRTRCAEILVSERRYRRALAALRMESAPEPRAHTAYYALAAYARRKLGQNERSARLYRTLAKIEPEKGKWWMGLGLCLERMERDRAALRAYERALGASGLDDEVRNFLQQRAERLD